jgi:hypothetical protein
MASDGDDYQDDEYVGIFADRERVGKSNDVDEDIFRNAIIVEGLPYSQAMKKISRMDKKKRFQMITRIYYSKFGGEKEFYVSLSELDSVITTLDYRAEHYHPVAFILGARVLDKKGISTERFETIFDVYRNVLAAEGIHRADVLRYARMWTRYHKFT